ncbi:hypothetical protein AYL99_05201 [Fonsecaea erecta]|uniref:Amidohydrolase-related domain-containing protein n=1 Tax=Fonsecaea erecta TaxID=1367422 RepID=A0A178ZK74_9EURO|nr:hypothetical protein AYL99_05201 [Fonsecaea erecta]OAP60199.1 hypothetical protein AYL99_05201 [Fonsecaea erecta]
MAPTVLGLEEHFIGKAVVDSSPDAMFLDDVMENLADLGPRRLEAMDRGNMHIQIVSHIPDVQPPELCRAVNDQLFAATQQGHGRLRGFAFLPMATPDSVAAELERCVKTLGFLGALIPNHANGRYYDDAAYWPMFEKAQELDVPIYLHPTVADDLQRYAGNYDRTAQDLIAGPGLCWHTDVATHVLRLYASGVFDAYPRLKLVLGHNGESLPFMLERVDRMFSRRWGKEEKRKRGFMAVWNENIWITTSGMYHLGPLRCCLTMCKPERVLFSVDYPFEDPKDGLKFMEELQRSGLVTEEQLDMICQENAKALLRI